MFAAMQCAPRRPTRRAWGAVVALCCAGLVGCAQIRSYQAPEAPTADKENFSPNSRFPANNYSNDSGRIVGQRWSARSRPALAQADDSTGWPQAPPSLVSRWRRFSHSLIGGKPGSGPVTVQAQNPEAQTQPIAVALQPPRPVPARGQGAGAIEVPTPAAEPAAAAAPAPGPARASASASTAPTLKGLVADARSQIDRLENYQVSLDRQERVGSTLLPAETVLLSIKRSPRAVRIEWPDGPHKGREVLYAADRDNGLMHIKMAEATSLVPRMSMKPDSPMALSNSRHPITEAGLETIIASLEMGLRLQNAGSAAAGKMAYTGLDQPEGLDHPCHKVERILPNGEKWLVYLDPQTKLPALVQGTARNGDLLERYVFRGVRTNLPELAAADAFDANSRWGPSSGGLLSRLARAGGTLAPAPAQ